MALSMLAVFNRNLCYFLFMLHQLNHRGLSIYCRRDFLFLYRYLSYTIGTFKIIVKISTLSENDKDESIKKMIIKQRSSTVVGNTT